MVKKIKRLKILILGLMSLVGVYLIKPILDQPVTENEDLVIYAYSSFAAAWGPGPELQKKYEALCKCKVKIVDGDDGRLLLQKVKTESKESAIDIVLGVNHWDVDEAVDKLEFSPVLNLPDWKSWLKDNQIQLDSAILNSQLIPFDWGILTFNTRRGLPLEKVTDLKTFAQTLKDQSLTLSDPRTSSPGWIFIAWLVDLYGENRAFDYLNTLSPKISVISSGWSGSYGLFQKGQAEATFSFVTSPLYHLIEEKNADYRAIRFTEELPVSVELAGVLKSCQHCEQAQKFLSFLLTDEAQTILSRKNYMFPINPQVSNGTPWAVSRDYHTLPIKLKSQKEKSRILERWNQWLKAR